MPNRAQKILRYTAFLLAILAMNAKIAYAEPNFNRALTDAVSDKLKRGTYFVLGIEKKIASQNSELAGLKNNIRALRSKISSTDEEIVDINEQIENLNQLIAQNRDKINALRILMAKRSNEIAMLEEKIKDEEKELETNQSALGDILISYYLQTNSFFDVSTKSPNLLALFSNESDGEGISDSIKKIDYLYFIQQSSKELAAKILETQLHLSEEKDTLKNKKEISEKMQSLLDREEKTLFDAMEAKKNLLYETEGKQAIYETLLELSKKEEEQVGAQMEVLKDNFEFFQEKLDALKNNPQETDLFKYDFALDEDDTLLKGDAPLAWPVSPSGGISAYFRDESYKRAIGIAHNAIDIRVAQGSKVISAAAGVVTKAVDNGYGYSYIIIAHPENVITLYGHISEILVSEGDTVAQGQLIGLSGGIPGTKGSGWLTTGAHLHFEVFKNWKHDDPLDYLPLEFLNAAELPIEYQKKMYNF